MGMMFAARRVKEAKKKKAAKAAEKKKAEAKEKPRAPYSNAKN